MHQSNGPRTSHAATRATCLGRTDPTTPTSVYRLQRDDTRVEIAPAPTIAVWAVLGSGHGRQLSMPPMIAVAASELSGAARESSCAVFEPVDRLEVVRNLELPSIEQRSSACETDVIEERDRRPGFEVGAGPTSNGAHERFQATLAGERRHATRTPAALRRGGRSPEREFGRRCRLFPTGTPGMPGYGAVYAQEPRRTTWLSADGSNETPANDMLILNPRVRTVAALPKSS